MKLGSTLARWGTRFGTTGIAVALMIGLLAAPAAAAKAHSSGASADLSLAVSDTPDPALLVDDVRYTVTVANRGPSSASVWVDFQLDGSALSGASPSQGACSVSNCSLGALASRASAQVTITAQPRRVGNISLLVSAATNVPDPDLSNNGRAEHTYVMAAPARAGCGGPFSAVANCKFYATGGPVTTAGNYQDQISFVCSPGIYCPLIHIHDPSPITVRLTDPSGRVVAECSSRGTCTMRSAEVVAPGTLLTCLVSAGSYRFGAGFFACTG